MHLSKKALSHFKLAELNKAEVPEGNRDVDISHCPKGFEMILKMAQLDSENMLERTTLMSSLVRFSVILPTNILCTALSLFES